MCGYGKCLQPCCSFGRCVLERSQWAKIMRANESSQVSPKARRQGQCKGGGGKILLKKIDNCTTCSISFWRLGNTVYTAHKWRKNNSRASHWTAFLATISQLPQTLYLRNISSPASQTCCGRPREGYVGSGCFASTLLTQRSAGLQCSLSVSLRLVMLKRQPWWNLKCTKRNSTTESHIHWFRCTLFFVRTPALVPF